MSSGVPVHIRNNVTAVLLSKPEGIPMAEFLSDYCNLHHEPLKFRDYGFTSLQNFLKSMPDVARMAATEEFEIMIFGVGEPDSYKPAIPLKTQGGLQKHNIKYTKVEKFSHLTGIPSLQTSPPKEDGCLEPDKFGLWSVCLPIEFCPPTPEALKAIFSQAGAVAQTNITEKWAFVRYSTKEEALLAIQMFSDLHVSFAKTNKKKKQEKERVSYPENQNKKMNGIKSDEKSDCGASLESFKTQLSNRGNRKMLQPYMSNALGDGDRVDKIPTMIDKIFGRCHIDERPNGYHSEQEILNGFSSTESKFANRKSSPYTASAHTDSRSGATALFISNIECEDDFREMIRPYDPVTIRVTKNKGKQIAFVRVNTEENARHAIENLHDRWQKTKCLHVYLDKSSNRNNSDSFSDGSISDTPSGSRSEKMKIKGIPSGKTDFTDMPPLIHVSELGDSEKSYQLDCIIYVANFPVHTLESTLRNAFAKYHVLDICMVNNGIGRGCTKAFLYLVTVYDVIQAIVEMNGLCTFGEPLTVDVPYKNTILRAVVDQEISKHRAFYPSPYGNTN